MKRASLPRFVAHTALLVATLSLPIAGHTAPSQPLQKPDAPDDGYMRLIEQVARLVDHRQNADALKLLDKAVEIRPKDYLAYCWKAKLFLTMDRSTDASSQVKIAESLNPHDCTVLRFKAEIQDDFGLFSQNQKLLQKAKKICQNALWFMLFSGRMLCATGNYQASIEPLSTFMQEYPNFNGASNPLTLSEAILGRYEVAVADLDRQSRSAITSLRTSPAGVMENKNLYLSVSKDIDRRIDREGLTTRNRFARAVCRYSQGKYSLCVQDAQELVKGKADLPTMWILLAHAQVAQKHFDEARSAVEKAISLAPQSELAYGALCELNFANRSYLHSVYELRARLKNDPRNAAIHAVLGRLYAELSMPDESIIQLNSALKENPARADILLLLAQMFEAKRDFDTAIADYSKAISLSHGIAFEALKGRAACYLEMHRYDSALADLNRLLAQFQAGSLLRAHAVCLDKMGRKSEAHEDRMKIEGIETYRVCERIGNAGY